MSFSFPKVKGFKKDKRNLIESTNNLVVFGHAQPPSEASGSKGRRLLRRGGLRQRRNSKPKSVFPPGVCSTTQKLDRLCNRVDLTNYFANTKPWNDKHSGSQQPTCDPKRSVSEINSVSAAAAVFGDAGSVVGVDGVELSCSHLPPPPPLITSIVGSPPQDLNTSPSMTFVSTIVCPVCMKGFEPIIYTNVPVCEVMKHSLAAYQQQNGYQNQQIFRKNLEEGWGASAKPKCVVEPQDVVVAGNCGELFHRLCLRDWCARGHRKSPRSSKPVANCPSCGKELKYTMCQEIEVLRSFSRDPTMLQKEFIKTKHVNKELHILWPETNNYLGKVKREIRDTETLYAELRSKRRGVKSELRKLTADDLSIVMANVTDVSTLKTSLGKQERALEFMQQETLQIMRMYLLTILRKLKECTVPIPSSGDFSSPEHIQLIGKIPPALVPYLQDIVNDDQSLSALSRILAPYQDDQSDESQQKFLEMQLIQKFAEPKSPPHLTRPNTYVVLSSAREVGESDSDDVAVKKLASQSSTEDEEVVIPVSSLKASTATHEITTIPSGIKQKNMLRAQTLSNLAEILKDKPPKLLKITEIADSISTINSRLLEERLMDLSTSPNGGGSVDKTYTDDPTSPNLSSPPSVQIELDLGGTSLSRFSKDSFGSSVTGDTTMSYHQYEQDSKYVRAIRQLIQSTPIDNTRVPQPTPQTVATSENSYTDEVVDPVAVVEDVLKIRSGKATAIGSALASATNSEINQLNETLIAFMRQQKHFRYDGLKKSNSNGNTENEKNDNAKSVEAVSSTASSMQRLPPPPNNSEKGSSNDTVGSAGEMKKEEKEDSWVTISTEREGPATVQTSLSRVTPSPPETKPSSNQSKSSNNSVKSCNKPNSLKFSRGSCEPVYTQNNQKSSPPEVVKSSEGGVSSVFDVATTPRKDDQVSIAIMYIIEDDEEDNEEGDKHIKRDKVQPSPADHNKELLPPPLPTKVLSPIYLTADKASNYSIIANECDSPPPPNTANFSKDVFAPIVWPTSSRMIPADTPSNTNINCSTHDMTSFYKTFYTDHQSDQKRNSLLLQSSSLPLPPLPEEMHASVQKRKSESIVPTLFYENETGMINCSNNKKLLAS